MSLLRANEEGKADVVPFLEDAASRFSKREADRLGPLWNVVTYPAETFRLRLCGAPAMWLGLRESQPAGRRPGR